MTDAEFTTEELVSEEWRPVVGYEGRYEVSSLGRVNSLNYHRTGKPGMLSPGVTAGYLHVRLYPNGRCIKIHALVAEAFIGPRPLPRDGYRIEVNHVDGIKANCRSSNLEWMTQLENMQHAARIGLRPAGDNHYSRARPELLARGARNGMSTHPGCTSGELNGRAKLTEANVADIRILLENGVPCIKLAKHFGVSDSAIGFIKSGKHWRCHANVPPSSPVSTKT